MTESAGAVEYKDSLSESPNNDTKQSDGEVPVMLKLWGMHRFQVHSSPEW